MSFVAKSGYKEAPVFDIRAVVEGIAAFYIVKVKQPLEQAFNEALASGATLDLTAYGEILHYGIDEPDAELKALLNRKYGLYQN